MGTAAAESQVGFVKTIALTHCDRPRDAQSDCRIGANAPRGMPLLLVDGAELDRLIDRIVSECVALAAHPELSRSKVKRARFERDDAARLDPTRSSEVWATDTRHHT
jgi:hypothetical protein